MQKSYKNRCLFLNKKSETGWERNPCNCLGGTYKSTRLLVGTLQKKNILKKKKPWYPNTPRAPSGPEPIYVTCGKCSAPGP